MYRSIIIGVVILVVVSIASIFLVLIASAIISAIPIDEISSPWKDIIYEWLWSFKAISDLINSASDIQDIFQLLSIIAIAILLILLMFNTIAGRR